MRVLAVAAVLLVVMVPPRARAAELLNDKTLPVPDEIGGGGDNDGPSGPESGGGEPSGEDGVAGSGADGLDDPYGNTPGGICSDNSEMCQAIDAKGVCQYACAMATFESCTMAGFACLGADAVTLGALTIPCGIVIVGACVGGAACMVACA